MKKRSANPKRRRASKRIKQKFPPGWNEREVRAVIKHYEQLSDEELAREIESAPEVTEETLMSVPADKGTSYFSSTQSTMCLSGPLHRGHVRDTPEPWPIFERIIKR